MLKPTWYSLKLPRWSGRRHAVEKPIVGISHNSMHIRNEGRVQTLWVCIRNRRARRESQIPSALRWAPSRRHVSPRHWSTPPKPRSCRRNSKSCSEPRSDSEHIATHIAIATSVRLLRGVLEQSHPFGHVMATKPSKLTRESNKTLPFVRFVALEDCLTKLLLLLSELAASKIGRNQGCPTWFESRLVQEDHKRRYLCCPSVDDPSLARCHAQLYNS